MRAPAERRATSHFLPCFEVLKSVCGSTLEGKLNLLEANKREEQGGGRERMSLPTASDWVQPGGGGPRITWGKEGT